MPAVPLARRPLTVPKDHERVLALLRRAGPGALRTADTFRACTAWLLGHVSVELRPMIDNPDESDPTFRLGPHRMPPAVRGCATPRTVTNPVSRGRFVGF
ncbi:hypothetical protein ACWC3X_15085 [Streptomyces populi]